MIDFARFQGLGFEDFRRMAQDSSLSPYEKIGFPDSYRQGYGDAIFADIRAKLTNLDRPNQTVLELGPGCSDPPRRLIELCRQQGHTLLLVDSAEMLGLLPDAPFITKIPARYPDECPQLFSQYAHRVDVIGAYSVLQIVFTEGNIYRFLDRSLELLADGGQMLLGDIPNVSRRKRFFSSNQGVRFHQAFMATDERPEVHFNTLEGDQIDDAVLMGMMLRARASGFDSFLLPQRPDLPMANRREDLLICKP